MSINGKKLFLAVMAFAVVLTANVFAEDYSEKEAKSPISRERAQQIALQRVTGGQVVDSEFNNRWFSDNDYEFTVLDANDRYDIKVDAKTGEVINVKQNPIFEDNLSAADRDRVNATANAITPQRARSIAMERKPNAMIVDMERDMEDGRAVYSIDMVGKNIKADMKIDGATGRILSYDEDRIDVDADMIRVENRSFDSDLRTVGAGAR